MMFTAPPPSGIEVRPARVLFVDDERLLLRSLERIVRVYHPAWEARFFHCPLAALEALTEFPADVLVTDLSMPTMSGIELLRTVRERYPEITRTVYSAHVESLERAGVGDLAHAALLKPAHPEAIVAMLRAVTNGTRGRPAVGSASA